MQPRQSSARLSCRMRAAIIFVLRWSSVVRASEAPFRSLDLMGASSSSSHQRFTRARIETPIAWGEEVFVPTTRLRAEGWNPHDLSVRSSEYATRPRRDDHISTRSAITSTFPSVPRSHELQLHLEEFSTTTTTTKAFVANAHDPFASDHAVQTTNPYKKTGTTIAGCICQDGHVILAADTRATQNTIVADKKAQKLHPLAQNAWCAGAGTSADLEMVTRVGLYSMALEQLRAYTIGNNNNNKSSDENNGEDSHLIAMYTTPSKEEDGNSLLVGKVSVVQICSFLQEKIWKGQGNLGVNLILGCVDQGKAYLRALHPHGSMDVDLPFAALGSGGLAAMSILERGYRRDLNVTEATELVQAAIVAGIQNDLGSGSQVDLCIIAPDGTSQMTRCVVPSQSLEELEAPPKETRLPPEDSAGTNGFGNSPFRIKSRRVLVSTKQETEWATFLGLPDATS